VTRDERGTAIVEFVWLAILLLVPLLYVVLAVFETQRAAYAASAAARSATRAYVTSPDQVTASERARAAAALAFRDQGIEAADFDLRLSCRPDPTACLSAGSVVVVEISSAVALPLVPTALGDNTPSIHIDARHQSPYGQFRESRP
jgi:hypothetical protein